MTNQATPEQQQTKRRRRWTIGGALGGAASIVTIITFITANGGTSSSQSGNNTSSNQNTNGSTTTSSSQGASPSQGGIPSLDLGSWGGFLKQNNGLTERFVVNLAQGTAGSNVGSFSNQTADCQGSVILNGETTVTLNGASVPAADLDLETIQNPQGACTSSAEAFVASSNGSILVFEVVTAGTAQGSFQDPLSLGDLTH